MIGKMQPRYKPTPEDDTPVIAERPTLSLCLEQDGALVIPPDIRSRYLADPTRSPEWRKLLQQFDRKWGDSSDDQATPPRNQEPSPSDQHEPPSTSGAASTEQASTEWASIFQGEPTDQDSLNSKYGAPAITFTISGTLTGVVVEGPKLFLVSSGDSTVGIDSPILCYGAGTWLLDARANTFIQVWGFTFCFELICPHGTIYNLSPQLAQSSNSLPNHALQENPDKGYVFNLDSDLALCVLEVWEMVNIFWGP